MNPPHDTQAEESIAGAAIVFRASLPELLDVLEPSDFYVPQVSRLWSVIEELHRSGRAVDHVNLADAHKVHGWDFDPGWLAHIEANCVAPRPEHAEVIVRHSTARKLMQSAGLARDEVANGADPYEWADRLSTDLAGLDTPVMSGRQQSRTLDDIIATADDVAPWVVPGLLRRDWRAVVVGLEGHGKSVLLRQIAACASQGIHPFRYSPIEPARVLVVDLENPAAAIAETGARLVERLRAMRWDSYDPLRLRFLMRPGGMDLRARHDRTELDRECIAHRPDLVVIGPVYKMLVRRDRGRETESHEEATDPVLRVLDDLRTRHGFALLMEHHAPQGMGGSRTLRPYGSQRWLAWPEIGLGMKLDQDRAEYQLDRWRGDRLRSDWPIALSRGRVWPWEGRYGKAEEDF